MTYQRNISWELEDRLDKGFPDGVEQPEVAAREDDEAQHDRSALADLAAVGPLDAAQLVDAVAEEGDQAAERAAAARGRLARPAASRRGRRRGGALLELVGVDALGEVVADLAVLEPRGPGLGQARLLDVRERVLRGLRRRGVAQAGVVGVGLVEPDVARPRAGRAGGGAAGTGLALGAALLRALAVTSHG